jgi:hypothetical protein
MCQVVSLEMNLIKITHAQSNPNACPPYNVGIIGEHDDSMKKFINYFLNNLDTNASFYPSMKKPTTLDMFSLLCIEIETQVEPKLPRIGDPSEY